MSVSRFARGFWSMPNQSASVRRAERKAVSPEVIGQTITPTIASTPPMEPSTFMQMSYTSADCPASFVVASHNPCVPL